LLYNILLSGYMMNPVFFDSFTLSVITRIMDY
jgi:hypothetical protein